MKNWAQADGYNTKTVKLGNATIYIKKPVLSKSEYDRREKIAQSALGALGRAIH